MRFYSDIRGTVEGRQFAKGRPVVDELPDQGYDGSADVLAFTNNAEPATEILAAFLLDGLRYAIGVTAGLALGVVMDSHLRHVMAIVMLHGIGF